MSPSTVASVSPGLSWPRRGLLLAALCVLAGTASTLFLYTLDHVLRWHAAHPWSLYLLPFLGLASVAIYRAAERRWRSPLERGTDLLLEQIHQPRAPLPWVMAPLIFVTTLLSHLGGASVGREGVGVQMSGGLADALLSRFIASPEERRDFLVASLGAGFASIFGAPWAGLFFGVEVIAHSRNNFARPRAWVYSALAAGGAYLVAHSESALVGLESVSRQLSEARPIFDGACLLKLLALGIVFGLLARAFVAIGHFLRGLGRNAYWRIAVSGALLGLSLRWVNEEGFQNLGLSFLPGAFAAATAWYVAPLKLLFTALSVGAGFKGGEVTPLFVIGSTAGSALAPTLAFSIAGAAALGFGSVFAGAAHVPLTCAILVGETFGWPWALFALVTCTVSWLVAGPERIYRSHPETELL